jgi:cell division protein FtsW (lipid II flippase)
MSGWGLLTIWRLFPAFGLRQSLWLALGWSLFSLGLRMPSNLSFLQRYKYVWLTTGLLLTALTVIFGTNPLGFGPRMWLGCCGIYFQPSEPLKLLLIAFLAAYLAERLPDLPPRRAAPRKRLPLLPLLAPTLVLTGVALLLLIFQRDLGTASIFLFLYTVIVFIAVREMRVLLAGSLVLILAAVIGYALFDVVRLRVDAWLNPWADPSGRSYQIVQSLLAVANGGIVGRGPGLGNPGLVPIPHSDFIFTAIAEESGLVGGLGMILLIALLGGRGMRIALRSGSAFHSYLAAGLTAYLVAQGVLIIGGNLRLLPLTGVTLPFVSYGGTSLVTSLVALLFLVHISNQPAEELPLVSPDPRPYRLLAGVLFAGLAGAALVLGWWAVYRAPVLVERTDNPRRAIADRSVPRGSILARDLEPIVVTRGEPGDYSRAYLYPPLSPVLGYTDPIYGQSGLEASMDAYLRGLQGYPPITIWWSHLLYGQPPPGLNVRLTLDMDLQRLADETLGDHPGALVLVDARSGEVLAMASHPGFDANQIETDWNEIIADPQAPLVNRATLGRYPAEKLVRKLLPESVSGESMMFEPLLRLPGAEMAGSTGLTPVQIAYLAAAISNGGELPAPNLVQAVKTAEGNWEIIQPLQAPEQIFSEQEAAAISSANQLTGTDLWHVSAAAGDSTDTPVTWYAGGSSPDWQGRRLALAVLLEEDDPEGAAAMGQSLLQAVSGG